MLEKKYDFLICIILYNKKLEESATYNMLKKQISDNDLVVVFDNSTIITNQKISDDIIYMSDNKNYGLSKAYNKVIKSTSDIDYDYFLIFDDDSVPEIDYLKRLRVLYNQNQLLDINYTLVKNSHDTIVSPYFHVENQFISHLIKMFKLDNRFHKYYIGINSGLVIKKNIIIDYEYDEKLFLDCVDWKFIEDQRAMNRTFKTLDISLNQTYHSEDMKNQSLDSIKNRFIIRMKDLKNYSKRHYFFNKWFLILFYFYKTKKFNMWYNIAKKIDKGVI